MKLKNLLLTLLVAFVAMPLAAQLQHGKIYRFVNKADTNIAMEASSTTDIYGTAKSNRYSHLWLAETHPNNSGAWSLRSLGNGLYVTPKGTSTMWTFSSQPSNSTVLYCHNTEGNYYTLNSANNSSSNTCMHYATSQGGAIVGWNTGTDATHWTLEEVTIDEAELQANWDELNAFNAALNDEFIAKCETALANLFTDKACTTLKKNFASVAAMEADADYKALPAELQAMARKVYTGDWSEDNLDSSKPGWDSEHAKRFRIQNIEPYSIAGEITAWLGMNAHINMDNPLGITGNYRQHVYVIVEGEIKSGAELYLGSLTGHGLLATYENGIRLHEGLNVIPFHANGNTLYINYVVHTYQNGQFVNPLDGYSDLKVHIAGGNVNGYYNGVGDCLWGEPDDDDDWQYYEDRTNTESATILGKRQILHFTMWPTVVSDENGKYTENNCMSKFFPDNVNVPAGTPAKQKVNKVLEAWDRIHLSELATMGLLSKAEMDSLNALYPRWNKNWSAKEGNIYDYTEAMYTSRGGVDYSKYFNHHGIALGNFSGYMSGGWRNCNYNQNTMGDIIGNIAISAGQAWGPAHEIGHQHQSVFTVNGLTEVTNNMFSNIAIWYMGMGTSRVNGTEGNLATVYENFKKGNHFLFQAHSNGSQNLWSQTQMYYRLWMYYHLTGHKTDFFPTLFELNRKDRMSSNNLGWIDGKGHASGTESMLKYYKQACQAAGEDLTEFFRAYGFFFLLNQKERGDYSTSFYTQTQAEVDAAIAWVKAQGYPENLAPIFINDCVAVASYGHDGKTKRSYWDSETSSGKNAKIGMYTDFIGESAKAEGYLYKLSGSTLNILTDNASGAVGFVAYSGDELVAFTNNFSVVLPVTAVNVKVYAVQADGTKVEIKSAAEGGTEEQQLSALTSAISAATTLLASTTDDGKDVGYYYDEEVTYLRELKAAAEAAKAAADQSVHTYGEWAILLNDEIARLRTDKSAFVRIKPGNIYRITNNATKSLRLGYYNGALKGTTNAEVPVANPNCHWEFVSTGVDNEFYMKNVGSGLFITTIDSEGAVITSPNSVGSAKFTIRYADGKINFMCANNASNSISLGSGNAVVGGEATESKSTWLVALNEDNASEVEKAQLEQLIKKATLVLTELENEEYVTVYADNIAELATALEAAEKAAEDNVETTINYAKYIDAIEDALANLEGAYVIVPVSSDKGATYWYYIKDVENNVYLSANESSCDLVDEIEAGNDNLLWGFIATGNEGEYKVYNASTGYALYTGTTSRTLLTTDGAADATPYTITPNEENKALVIESDGKYWYNQRNAARLYRSEGYWKLELAVVKSGDLTSSIEEIGAEEVAEGIYDLTGRRIEQIVKPGVYVVNGKKTVIK